MPEKKQVTYESLKFGYAKLRFWFASVFNKNSWFWHQFQKSLQH